MTTETTIEATVSSVATKGMGGGTGATLAGLVLSNEVLALIGVVITFLGFVVNLIFKMRDDRRKQERHMLELAALRRED